MREIVIRHSEPEDCGAVRLVYSPPNAMVQTPGLPFSGAQEWREDLARSRDDHVSLVACAPGEVVGHPGLGVYANPRTRHFGIAVRNDWQRKRVGTALVEAALDLADNRLNLVRLDLRVYVDAAIALYEKFGFEGTHRRFAFRDGGYVDARVMARLTA